MDLGIWRRWCLGDLDKSCDGRVGMDAPWRRRMRFEAVEGTLQRSFAVKGSGEARLQLSKDTGPAGCFFLKLGDTRVCAYVAERETSMPEVDLLVR